MVGGVIVAVVVVKWSVSVSNRSGVRFREL